VNFYVTPPLLRPYWVSFILSEPRIQFVIPATRRLDHLRDNMAAGAGYLPDTPERACMREDFRKL
jgi:aryl-alcohol dehydrogenase-like predicted oxidoreductase